MDGIVSLNVMLMRSAWGKVTSVGLKAALPREDEWDAALMGMDTSCISVVFVVVTAAGGRRSSLFS
jgi:hypothetical protein